MQLSNHKSKQFEPYPNQGLLLDRPLFENNDPVNTSLVTKRNMRIRWVHAGHHARGRRATVIVINAAL